MGLFLPRVRIAAWLGAALVTGAAATGCSTPPQKELDQAQATIEVAVAAGADRIASAELASARAAYTQAQEAIAQRDYKLALGHALDSRERALTASRAAAATRSKLKDETARALVAVSGQLTRLDDALAAPPRALRPQVRQARASHTRLHDALQKARAAIAAEDYIAADALLAGVRRDLDALLQVWSPPAPAVPAQSSRTKT
jgi:hypothetical protein